ncbi:MAG: hypothetical protein Q7R65_01430 [bacterium]|nr:hypothetical protein [bacterium]
MSDFCFERGFDRIMIKVFGLGLILVMEKTTRGNEFRAEGSISIKGPIDHYEARRVLDGMEERIRKGHARALEDDLRILSEVQKVLTDRLGPPKT